MTARPWVASFDVTSDRRRVALTRVLHAHGYRALFSVFDLELSPPSIAGVAAAVTEVLRPGDHLLMLPRCSACHLAGLGRGLEGGGAAVVAV